ncbi:hypothetical protein C7Y71_005355 [Pseudoprevotella muciniphila]|uniref:HIRAN domain-containing protein n=1 Tax=Pseudoprevotella muciniphila TaxID=2133944 RepID=A0A5P8E6C5_9BACT|nr:hypothetical protein [Pseudoprevotella muciniphila]QFQ12484.1 hypothetical protein C7Y71_005355 [Pseudoprevotella muciniphila]
MNELAKISPSLLALIDERKDERPPLAREVFLVETVLRDTSYNRTESVFYMLKEGTEVEMRAVPDSDRGPLAVEVVWNDTSLGWLPEGQDGIFSALLAAGKRFVCRISRAKQYNEFLTERPMAKITVKISMLE